MTQRSTINQIVQLGAETTRGTAVPAAKLLSAWDWVFGEKVVTKQWPGTGRKYPQASAMLQEYAAGKISGHGDFAALVYPLSSIYGPSNPAPALVGTSLTVFGWNFKPVISGPANPTTFTVQQGNASDDSQQYAYVIFTGWGYSFDRKVEVSITADWLSQTFTDGIAMTAAPSNIALLPMTGAMANIYLDTTSAGLGTTQLVDFLKFDYKASNYYGMYWPVNRANASFTSHIDLRPKCEFKITLTANTLGMALRSAYLELDTVRAYLSVNVTGPQIDGVHPTNAQMTHNAAVFISDMQDLIDVDGIYAVEFTLQVAEDTAWTALAGGTAQTLLLQNLLSAL